MRNFSDAQNVLQSALNSTNSAWEENARYMESIEAKQAKLQAQIQQFVLGDGGLEALEKKLLDIGTTAMQFLNNIGGLQTVLTAIGTILTMILVPTMASLITTIGSVASGIGILITNFITARQAGYTFSMALNEIGVSGITTTAAIQGLVAVIGAVIVAFNMYNQAQIKARQAAYDAEQTALSQADTIQKQIDNLQKESQSREDLVKAIQAVDNSYKDEGQSIDELNKKRQESINKLKEEKKAQLETAKDTGWEQYRKDKSILSGQGYTSATTKTGTGITRGIVTGYQQQAKAYGVDFDASTLENYIASLKRLSTYSQETGTRIKGLSADITNAENVFKQATQGINQYEQVLYALNLKYNEITGNLEKMSEAEIAEKEEAEKAAEQKAKTIGILEELGVNIDEISDKLSDGDLDKLTELLVAGDLDGIVALLEQYGIEIENATEHMTEFEAAVSDFIGTAEGMQSAYETLNKAAEEYNEKGYITAATLKKLAKLEPEYAAQLDLVNGKMVVTNGTLQEQFEVEKQLALIHIQTAEQLDIVAYCQEYLGQETDKTTNSLANDVTNAQALTVAYSQLTDAGYQAAEAIATVRAEGRDDDTFRAGLEERRAKWKQYYNEVNAMELDYNNTSKSNAGSHKDAWVEAFKEEKDALDNLKETEQITEYEYYERLKDLNEKYFGEISGNHQKYLKEYRENEEEVYKGLKGVYNQVKDYLKEAVEHGYEKAINALKKEEKKVLAEIKKQIEAIKKEKEEVIKGIDKQIKALKKEKEAVEKYYNDQIDAIKRENEVLQEQNELLEKQQELQKAKQQKVMVMQQGRFQLTENESAVAQAEQNLSNYEDQLSYEQQIQQLEDLRDATVESIEERIEALEEYKEFMEEYYDEQIEAMEEYYDQVQEEYEKQIEALQEQLDAFKEGYQKEEDLENARLAAQVLGMNERKDLYEEELSNLKDYINEVNAMLALLGEPGAVVDYSYSPKTGYHTGISEVAGVDMSISSRASGDSNFAKDEMALVGESPNAELVLGSRLNRSVNSGELVHLSKGSGVVNAESTQTLAGLLNGLSTPTNVANNRSTQQNFTFGNISLPNVTDANSFVNTLSNKFNNYAIQYGNTRK